MEIGNSRFKEFIKRTKLFQLISRDQNCSKFGLKSNPSLSQIESTQLKQLIMKKKIQTVQFEKLASLLRSMNKSPIIHSRLLLRSSKPESKSHHVSCSNSISLYPDCENENTIVDKMKLNPFWKNEHNLLERKIILMKKNSQINLKLKKAKESCLSIKKIHPENYRNNNENPYNSIGTSMICYKKHLYSKECQTINIKRILKQKMLFAKNKSLHLPKITKTNSCKMIQTDNDIPKNSYNSIKYETTNSQSHNFKIFVQIKNGRNIHNSVSLANQIN